MAKKGPKQAPRKETKVPTDRLLQVFKAIRDSKQSDTAKILDALEHLGMLIEELAVGIQDDNKELTKSITVLQDDVDSLKSASSSSSRRPQ